MAAAVVFCGIGKAFYPREDLMAVAQQKLKYSKIRRQCLSSRAHVSLECRLK